MQISPATEKDIELLSTLLDEVQEYYGAAPPAADPEQIRAALFGDRPAATVLLARDGDTVLGLASYGFLWPAYGPHTALYLKELFVRKQARRKGVAQALMSRLEEIAVEAGCSRIEWTADADNPAALAFYESFGARPVVGKLFYLSPV